MLAHGMICVAPSSRQWWALICRVAFAAWKIIPRPNASRRCIFVADAYTHVCVRSLCSQSSTFGYAFRSCADCECQFEIGGAYRENGAFARIVELTPSLLSRHWVGWVLGATDKRNKMGYTTNRRNKSVPRRFFQAKCGVDGRRERFVSHFHYCDGDDNRFQIDGVCVRMLRSRAPNSAHRTTHKWKFSIFPKITTEWLETGFLWFGRSLFPASNL